MRNIYKLVFTLSNKSKQLIQNKGQVTNLHSEYNSNKQLRKYKSNKKMPTYILEIDEIQDKVKKVKSTLYNTLAQRFEGKEQKNKQIMPIKISQANKTQKKLITQITSSGQPYQFNKQIYTTVPKINILMNAAVSIQFDPQSIKYQYQQSVQTLVQNIFSQETEKNLRKKQKSMANALLDGFKMQKDLIENLLMLYGLRKEEQFQENLIDPVQKILSKKTTERRTIKYLADMINKMNTRKDYYEQIIIYLPLQSLMKFTKTASLIKKIDIVSQITKYNTLLQISEFILKNIEVQKICSQFNQFFFSRLDEKQKRLKRISEIELWILQNIQNFLYSFQSEQFGKEALITVIQNLQIYQKIKQKLQTLVKDRNLNKLFSQTNQSYLTNAGIQELVKLEQLLGHKQSEQFYQKIFQIILFLDNEKYNIDQQIQIYSSIFKILLKFQDIKIPDHIFQKVIDDHMAAFKKIFSLQTVSQCYIRLLTQFVMRNLQVKLSNQYALALVKIFWLHNIEKNINKEEMTFDQGKYFVMSLHIISSYFKKINQIHENIIRYQVLIKTMRKYTVMIHKQRNQFYSLNKAIVLEMLEKALTHLFQNNNEKDTVNNFIQEIKTIAQNQDS